MYDNRLASFRDPICSLCNLPVPLNRAKTDEDGNAVHEHCYVIKVGVAKPVITFSKTSRADVANAGQRKQQS
jgi:hypothetical protein